MKRIKRGWAAVATAISVLMGALENQGGIAGTIAARLVGMAWSLVTFIAVPRNVPPTATPATV